MWTSKSDDDPCKPPNQILNANNLSKIGLRNVRTMSILSKTEQVLRECKKIGLDIVAIWGAR